MFSVGRSTFAFQRKANVQRRTLNVERQRGSLAPHLDLDSAYPLARPSRMLCGVSPLRGQCDALFRAMAARPRPVHNACMSSPLLLSNVEPPVTLPLPPADVCAAEAFDDEAFSMNVTVD